MGQEICSRRWRKGREEAVAVLIAVAPITAAVLPLLHSNPQGSRPAEGLFLHI